MMKAFKEFNEGYKPFGEEKTASSIAFSNSRKAVLKKSKHGIYSDLEFEVHEMMSKRIDLFPKVIKNTKELFLTEKLDVDRFSEFYEESKHVLEGQAFFNFIEQLNMQGSYEKIKNYKNTKEYDFNYDKLQKSFIDLKLEIYEYFEDFILDNSENFAIKLDIHGGNFGFKIGTDKIVCFDPIYVKIK